MAVGVDADLEARTADLRFDGLVSPALLNYAASRTGRNLGKLVSLSAPMEVSGGARFGRGWKFERVAAWVATRDLKVRGVSLDEARGRIEYDGRSLTAPEASVRSGDNFARGSYEQDIATRDYRFLLEGRLRPLAIASWFPRWWPALFQNLGFPSAPPAASIDLRGRWTDGRRTSLFVQADSPGPVIMGAAFDRVCARLFLRPTFLDGLEILATRGDGQARGTFVRRIAAKPGGTSQSIDFEGTSTLDLRAAARIFGHAGSALATRLDFARPPTLVLKGSVESRKAPDGIHRTARVVVRSDGAFQLFNWPIDQVGFTAVLRDGDLTMDPVAAVVVGGTVDGRLSIRGTGPDRSVAFEAACKGASLGQAIVAAEGYFAQRKGTQPRASTTFLKERATVRLDMNVSAEGRYADPFSYQGGGKVSLEGPQLGELRVLGLLSELLKFTSLRFTSARADFKVAGRKLDFSNVRVTGANSGIDAHGSYALDRHELDFRARIYPFEQSKLLPEKLVGVVLTPFSDVFEVRLTGSSAKPSWELANGPSSLLHNLGQAPVPAAKPPAVAPPAH
jgi:hypothetical protein